MGRFAVFSTLLTTGRLALRLLRDRRVPLYAKAVPLLALLYAVSPLDFVPDLIPVLGQLDDAAVLMAGLEFFIKLCPGDVVDEHREALGQRPTRTVEGRARPVNR
jgi:uncharacterized membrane protein YkvA (DUF1232 family)